MQMYDLVVWLGQRKVPVGDCKCTSNSNKPANLEKLPHKVMGANLHALFAVYGCSARPRPPGVIRSGEARCEFRTASHSYEGL